MKFAFIVHPLSARGARLQNLPISSTLQQLWGTDLFGYCRTLQDELAPLDWAGAEAPSTVQVVDELCGFPGRNGGQVEGRFYEIPACPAEILADPTAALAQVEQAVQAAHEWGAEIIGLGALTGVIGAGGAWLADQVSVAVTTGNSLTSYAAVQNLFAACAALEIDLREETVAIVGMPGSVATAVARLLAPHCGRLLAVGRTDSTRLRKRAAELGAEPLTEIPAALRAARIVLSATSSGNCLDPALMRPGTLVLDIGVPTDLLPLQAPRPDLLLLSGGLTMLPAHFPVTGRYLWLHRGALPSCLAETIILAVEDRRESYSLGRDLDPDRVQEIGSLARVHGFCFSRFFTQGRPLPDETLCQFARHRPRRTGFPTVKKPVAGEAARAFRAHLNPVLAEMLEQADLARSFVRGEGCRLWDESGCEYLDFVAGFGSVNVGHHPPRIVAAITQVLAEQAAGFTPGTINPHAAALAEKLVSLSPPGLEMVTFVNSGTEAVEAALKTARAATGRPSLVSCTHAFHGKTFGALSVTANPAYRQPFGPLLPECRTVPYGDAAALAQALRGGDVAGFIVEPIAAEGGMRVPPPGYLRAVRDLCTETGTLFIADEIQTGLGRTGRRFAVDSEQVAPDLLCLAKSLGGGLLPIGAVLSRKEIWLRAYGTFDTCTLHSSTFAGGSLACAAGLATLDTLEEDDLADRAEIRGAQLRAGLEELCRRFSQLREVRGRGLLLGLEFHPLPAPIVEHWCASAGSAPYLVPQFRQKIAALPAFYVMQSLLRQHAIYTQLCRSQPLVLRIEPPLIVSPEEVQRFLEALARCCTELEFTQDLFLGNQSKSIRGQIEPLVPPQVPAADDCKTAT